MHAAPRYAAAKRELAGLRRKAHDLARRGRLHHRQVETVVEGKRPARRADQDEIAVREDLAVLDQRLHRIDKRDVCRAAGVVVGQTEKLADADLEGASLAGVVFESSRSPLTRLPWESCS